MTSYRYVAAGHDGRLRARGPDDHQPGTADDPTEPPDPWPLGAVVAFRRRRGTTGFGQIERVTHSGFITIRTWLPCPTRNVTCPPGDVRLIATLDQLHAHLLEAAR